MQGKPAWLAILGLLAFVHPAVLATKASPLGKAIQLLQDLATTVGADGEREKKSYYKYFEWCDDTAKNTEYEVKTAAAVTSKLTARITDLESQISVSSSKIDDLAAAIAANRADLESANAVRKKEASDFANSEAELMDAIDTLGRAVEVLTRETQNGASFAQIDSAAMAKVTQSLGAVIDAAAFASDDRQKLQALVQTGTGSSSDSDSDDSDTGAPEADSYKSHSSGIMDTLEDLKEKAESQLAELRKAEGAAKQNYRMLKQSLENQHTADQSDMSDEKTIKASASEAKAVAEGDLKVSSDELAHQKEALKNVKGTCIQIAADHEKSVHDRESEVQTLAKAIQVLQETTGGAEEQTYSFVQTAASRRRSIDFKKNEVVTLVKALAKEHHSVALAQLSARILAVLRYSAADGDNPFQKVKGLIETLIENLEKEASDEASEKAYCDEEMAKTAEKIGELKDDISKMSSKIDQAVARSTELKKQVAELQKELAQLATQESSMDAIRGDTHSSYVTSKVDLEQGLSGVQKAVGILRNYYSSDDASSASAAASFFQEDSTQSDSSHQPEPPQNHEQATGAGNSIISILEVVESDFARNLASEEEEESDSQASYDKTKQEIAITRTQKIQDVKYKTQEFLALDKSISDVGADRQTSNSELAAVSEYEAKVKDRCVAKPEGYAARKAAREAEIKGLKEALAILENDVAFLQPGHRAGRKFRGSTALSAGAP